MEIKPEDIKVEAYSLQGNWGISDGVRVIVTHIPTGIKSVCKGKLSMHKAKQIAFEDLIKCLSNESDYNKQLELFE